MRSPRVKMRRRRYAARIAYDGTDFSGFQSQASGRTVQGVLQEALERLHRAPVPVVAAGRTDAGVHAEGQVIGFDSEHSSLDAGAFPRALNSNLPADVRVLRLWEAPEDFHPRYDARHRHYRYQLQCGESLNPMSRRYALWIPRAVDAGRLNELLAPLLGCHDFRAFAAAGDQSASKVRCVTTASAVPGRGLLNLRISGNAFLWTMVRSIVGTALMLEQQRAEPSAMQEILAAGDRSRIGAVAPPHGLFLERVDYND
jgi:tRNA pseudouridine38-40 synthase